VRRVTAEARVHGRCDPRFAPVRELFARGFSASGELGAAACFELDGEPVVDLWGGFCDRERTREWQPDTLVNVYSTTKGMTAICAHQLVERGLLELDAPVASYWPEFGTAGKAELPVRYLLDHRAGLPALRAPLPEQALYDWKRMSTALAEEDLWWEPGARLGYHALTFGYLVGELIRRISGLSVGAYLREHVTGPLGADFHIGLSESQQARTASLHGRLAPPRRRAGRPFPGPLAEFLRDLSDPSTMTGAAFNNPHQPDGVANGRAWRAAEIPAANGHGTARAIARIYGALARGGAVDGVRILESRSIEAAIEEQAFAPDVVLGGLPMRFGLGFMLRQDFVPLSPGRRAFGHPGAGGSLGMADPDAKVGFGYTMNRMHPRLLGSDGAFAMIRAFFDAL
jgi:CubicO group peptidase (beta-lactamase class C family)